jgi:hypothetical protein
MKSFRFSQINECQHIFFEAATSKSDTTIQEFITNSGVSGDTFFNFFDIGLIFLAQNGNTIN